LLGKSLALTAQLSNCRSLAEWDNHKLGTLPGDFGGLASGISSKGQVVVGSTWDSNFDWSHAFIWQNGVMTDLNTLLPASSNLYATMANKINDRGQISGMAIGTHRAGCGQDACLSSNPCKAKRR
jgi:probable HAF family extracellular repeat protein